MAKLLIVDDEFNIRHVVKEYAMANNHDIDEADNGADALRKVTQTDYDVIILDIMMPKMDGFTACREIKKVKDVPIIILSARQEEYDKLKGFELGVDDYVIKPFSPKELMARINVVIGRHKNSSNTILAFGGLSVDEAARNVYIDEVRINLTPKEFDLLLYLIKNKNVALSREVLLENVWNYTFFGDDRTVDTHIKMLRHSLKHYRDYVKTVRGMGYKFEV
jgi:two-component system, OmpR family, response regulator ResD